LSAATGIFLKRQLKHRIERIGKDIAALERELLRRIKTDETLARRYAILTSIAGFGPVVAATLIACLAELG
ncbi:IS110 family transposase, partial [Salmonella enterica subsp. enterica serovar Minnesota]